TRKTSSGFTTRFPPSSDCDPSLGTTHWSFRDEAATICDGLITAHGDRMDRKARLLARLDAIGESLKNTGDALALLGLGSVGLETARIDDYSDLDFFAIVKTGCKQAFIDDLGWLSVIHPVVYTFRNTRDG